MSGAVCPECGVRGTFAIHHLSGCSRPAPVSDQRCACCGIEAPVEGRTIGAACIAADCLISEGCRRTDDQLDGMPVSGDDDPWSEASMAQDKAMQTGGVDVRPISGDTPPPCPLGCKGPARWVEDAWYCRKCGSEWATSEMDAVAAEVARTAPQLDVSAVSGDVLDELHRAIDGRPERSALIRTVARAATEIEQLRGRCRQRGLDAAHLTNRAVDLQRQLDAANERAARAEAKIRSALAALDRDTGEPIAANERAARAEAKIRSALAALDRDTGEPIDQRAIDARGALS